jgi:hypothetical protein
MSALGTVSSRNVMLLLKNINGYGFFISLHGLELAMLCLVTASDATILKHMALTCLTSVMQHVFFPVLLTVLDII